LAGVDLFELVIAFYPTVLLDLFQGHEVYKVVYFYFSFLFFGFCQPNTAPIATPTAIHTGSFVAAKTAVPIAVPTPIQVPALPEFLIVLFTLLFRRLYLFHCD
tara:strand:- start:3974 stop:4282 length:309 start_codon:yes stop_codon:yes gene_type:complete